ncbi:MAG TPA: hypothetical protein PLT92_14220 [Ignavibacteriaceae bacterium]|nr:hypothetical protein [Ignavibacteriaceae bacterium]
MKVLKIFGINEIEFNIIKIKKREATDDFSYWYLYNLIYPLAVVFFPTIFLLFTNWYNKKFIEIIFNGALSLIGINVLATMASYMKSYSNVPDDYDGNDTKKYFDIERSISKIRSKLTLVAFLFGMIGAGFYLVQLAFDFRNNTIEICIVFCLTIIVVLMISIYIGKYLFILSSPSPNSEMSNKLLFQQLDKQTENMQMMYDQLKREL